jgi:CheY-like chemotaxis protein
MDDSGTNLLVEDNQNDVELILAALNEGRLVEKICVAGDGQEALDYLYRRAVHRSRAAEYPKMILLDFKLPKVDRLEVLQRIKADPDLKATPVVALTSSREERDVPRSYNLGTNAYVVKPMSFRFFTETVKEVGLFWGGINQPPSTAEREL